MSTARTIAPMAILAALVVVVPARADEAEDAARRATLEQTFRVLRETTDACGLAQLSDTAGAVVAVGPTASPRVGPAGDRGGGGTLRPAAEE
jgi:hypothetical protein